VREHEPENVDAVVLARCAKHARRVKHQHTIILPRSNSESKSVKTHYAPIGMR
jgi:hypothetical protein